jgi:MoxR-like ATPase
MSTDEDAGPASVRSVVDGLAHHSYLADEGLATAVFLALTLPRPLLVEGDAGVGKTELARAIAEWRGGDLIRLQCYEGLDVHQALYEWDYSRQLLHLRTAEAIGQLREADAASVEDGLYSDRFLIRRPLLRALASADNRPPVLLIDEIDRADDEFEAFLLELLADYAVTIPELGTITAAVPPTVIITSNRTRDVHDALRRRCLYHWVEHPDLAREVAIVRMRAPEVSELLARQVAALVGQFRGLGLYKPPGVAESIDWAQALDRLGIASVDSGVVRASLGSVLKYREDQERVLDHDLDALVEVATGGGS